MISENERNLRDFFDSSPLLMGVIEVRDHDLWHVMCNRSVANLFGIAQQEMENVSATSYGLDLSLIKEWVDRCHRVEQDKRPMLLDHYFPVTETLSWFSVTISHLGKSRSGHSRFSYVIADITNRKITEQTHETRFKMILEHSPIMIDAFDNEGNCYIWSKSCERLLGWTQQEVLESKDFFARCYPDPEVQRKVMNSIQRADGTFNEYQVTTKTGQIAYQMWANFRLPNQSNISIGYDVTERKATEQELAKLNDTLEQKVQERTQELQQSESRLRLALEANRMGCWDHDLVTGKVTWSDSFIRLLGLEPGGFEPSFDILNQTLHPGYRELIQRVVVTTIQGRRDHQIEFRIVTPEGEIRWLLGIGSPIFDEQGHVIRMVGIVMDITERKQVETIVSEQRAKMISASKMSALGEMSSGIAHEINNPLAIIHGNARRLRDLSEEQQVISAPIVQEIAQRIESTAMRISKIVKALKSFAREGEDDPYVESRIATIVEETAELCRERFKHHGVELRIDPISPGLMLECRPVQISQVLLNLLNNAHDAVAELKERWVRIGVRDDGNEIEFQVEDSGPGISAELRERVFVPFFTTKPLGQGTGLGLSVSKGIIERHGGSLTLEYGSSRTLFLVRVPKGQMLRVPLKPAVSPLDRISIRNPH